MGSKRKRVALLWQLICYHKHAKGEGNELTDEQLEAVSGGSCDPYVCYQCGSDLYVDLNMVQENTKVTTMSDAINVAPHGG